MRWRDEENKLEVKKVADSEWRYREQELKALTQKHNEER